MFVRIVTALYEYNTLFRCRACEVPRFENLLEDEWYRIALPSFLVTAGDGYDPFETCGRNHKVGYLDSDLLAAYMKKISPIIVGTDGRVTFLKTVKATRAQNFL